VHAGSFSRLVSAMGLVRGVEWLIRLRSGLLPPTTMSDEFAERPKSRVAFQLSVHRRLVGTCESARGGRDAITTTSCLACVVSQYCVNSTAGEEDGRAVSV